MQHGVNPTYRCCAETAGSVGASAFEKLPVHAVKQAAGHLLERHSVEIGEDATHLKPVGLERGGPHSRANGAEPDIQVLAHCVRRWRHVSAGLLDGKETDSLALGLALLGEPAVPTSFPLSGVGVVVFDHDGRRTGRCGDRGRRGEGRWVAVAVAGLESQRAYLIELDESVVDIAVPPRLARLETPDHGVAGSMEVFGGVRVRRFVTTPNMTALHASPQMNPASPDLKAFDAANAR